MHRLQVGVEVGDRVTIEFPIDRGKLTYEGEIGQISASYVKAMRHTSKPVLFVPIGYILAMNGPLPGGHIPLQVLIDYSKTVTVRPHRNIWNDPKWNVPAVNITDIEPGSIKEDRIEDDEQD